MHKSQWQIVIMFQCHLNEQKKNSDQGNHIIFKLKGTSCTFHIFSVV